MDRLYVLAAPKPEEERGKGVSTVVSCTLCSVFSAHVSASLLGFFESTINIRSARVSEQKGSTGRFGVCCCLSVFTDNKKVVLLLWEGDGKVEAGVEDGFLWRALLLSAWWGYTSQVFGASVLLCSCGGRRIC